MGTYSIFCGSWGFCELLCDLSHRQPFIYNKKSFFDFNAYHRRIHTGIFAGSTCECNRAYHHHSFFVMIKKEDKKNPKRFLSILITDLLVLWAIYVFFSIVIPQIANSIRTILEQFPSYINTFGLWIANLLNDNPEFQKSVMDFIYQSSTDFTTVINSEILPQLNSLNNVTEMLSQFSGLINVITSVSMSVYSIFKEIWNLVIGFIISIYLLSSKELLPPRPRKWCMPFVL